MLGDVFFHENVDTNKKRTGQADNRESGKNYFIHKHNNYLTFSVAADRRVNEFNVARHKIAELT